MAIWKEGKKELLNRDGLLDFYVIHAKNAEGKKGFIGSVEGYFERKTEFVQGISKEKRQKAISLGAYLFDECQYKMAEVL